MGSFDITQMEKGALTTPEFLFNVQAGLIPGFKQERKFGLNPDVDPADTDFVWDGQGTYTYDTVNTTLYIVSTDVLDTQTIMIKGLIENNGDWIEKSASFNLNGTTPVNIGEFIRVFRMRIVTAPRPAITTTIYCSTKAIIGVPILSELRAQIEPNRTTTLMAMYTVPSGHTAFMYRAFFSCYRLQEAEFDLEIRPFNGLFTDTAVLLMFEKTEQFEVGYERIEAKSDMRVRVSTDTNNTKVAASFHLIIVENKYLNSTVKESV